LVKVEAVVGAEHDVSVAGDSSLVQRRLDGTDHAVHGLDPFTENRVDAVLLWRGQRRPAGQPCGRAMTLTAPGRTPPLKF
jgi:hypothetical protein